MATTDVIRPVSIRKSGAGTAVPSSTLNGVTSDNSDSTYIKFLVANEGDNWNLRCGPHTPSAGMQRHRLRGRIRIATNAGTCIEDIDVGRAANDWIQFQEVNVTSVIAEVATDWFQDAAYGLNTAGALSDLNIGGGWLDEAAGGATEGHTAECYIDIDCRSEPGYSPEVQDAAGADQTGGTVTDTNQPTLFFGAVNYDGLPQLDWSVNVTDAGSHVVFTASGSGTPPTSIPVTSGLDDGPYTATFTVRSTIRGADPFANVEVNPFTIQNTVPPPSPPLVTVTAQDGGYLVSWENPGGQPWDDDFAVAEVFRDDCTGSQRIATIEDALNGSYLDLAIPQLDSTTVDENGVCTAVPEVCDITYRVRYWGYVSTSVELPDTIPADMILAWPDTVASIPSGWTRVTALDGFYPRGASTTAAPTATGGGNTHGHTTAGHRHVINAHSHGVGGSTGTSNSSTTSARFNGASQPQADQPHSHTRPGSTGTFGAVNPGVATPAAASVASIPATRDVIWIQSNGSQANYPTGVLGFATESVSGWDTDTTSAGRYLRGAAAAGNGGAVSGANTHTHGIGAHTHAGFNHDHTIGNTSLSNPSSSQEAGDGSSTPRWLPRHTHPLNVATVDIGDTNSASGGNTNAVNHEPPHRRLRILRNTGGGTQTRIIGLYLGTAAALDPLLTLCNGSNGTPDMRTFFCRDVGSDAVNSTGGATAHSHTTPGHSHTMPSHGHGISVGTSNTGSFEAPSRGDLGDSPTTGHTHSSGGTATATPTVTNVGSGDTSSTTHTQSYHEAHFVRLDGTISGGPLPVPELKVSDFSLATVPSFTYGDDLDRISSLTTEPLAIATSRSSSFPRLVAETVPLDGGFHTISTTVPGEVLTLAIAVEGRDAIDALEDLLAADRIYWSPLGGTPGWFAPGAWSVTSPVTNVWVLTVPLVRQPWPTTPDPGDFL